MDLYSLLRQMADSWGLLSLLLVFLGVIVFAFRPGSRKTHEDIAMIPLRNDDRPLPCGDDHSGRRN